MILVHRLSGEQLHLNADLIESVEATADTVITLVDGRRVLVQESPSRVVELVRDYRASLLVAADSLRDDAHGARRLTVVEDEDGRVDVMLLAGLLIAFLGIAAATLIDGNDLGPLLGPSAFLLVFTATFGATVMSHRREDLRSLPGALLNALSPHVPDVHRSITTLARLSEAARRDGMLSLEGRLTEDDDRLIHRGVELLVDGVDEDIIRETLQIEIAATDERHRTPIIFFRSLAGFAPTFGMVGTIIGLINMLGNLQDPASLGTGLALALLTTFYGVLLANLVFNPVANRLERLNQTELAALDLAFDGLLSIHRGASPRALVERLESYVPPAERVGAATRLSDEPVAEATGDEPGEAA